MSEYKTTSESTKDITSFWEDVKNLSLATHAPVKASDEDERIQDIHKKAMRVLRDLYFNEVNRHAEEVKKQREKAVSNEMLLVSEKLKLLGLEFTVAKKSKIARVVNIHIRNDVIGDRFFMPTVADTLIKYATMIKNTTAGRNPNEYFDDDNGNRVTIIGGRLSEEESLPSPALSDYDSISSS
ncbi:hypothetical protein J6Z61_003433 [Salmonella enterica subsp. enterica serovar Newport]|nr:hypothetical protein [Salmonella enterica subsp. enterica serovar Newport]